MFNSIKVLHSTVHHINTIGLPVFSPPHQLAPDRFRQAKDEIDHMLQRGLIHPSKSPWASPLHLVRKSEADFRPVGDYQHLNSVTLPDRYSIPNIQNFSANQYGCTIFSKINLIQAYHQIPVNPVDILKKAITIPFGNFGFLFMPFGLQNAASTFQRFIDEVVRGLNFIFAYVDDVLVASNTKENHVKHLSQLFERLSEYHVCTHKC